MEIIIGLIWLITSIAVLIFRVNLYNEVFFSDGTSFPNDHDVYRNRLQYIPRHREVAAAIMWPYQYLMTKGRGGGASLVHYISFTEINFFNVIVFALTGPFLMTLVPIITSIAALAVIGLRYLNDEYCCKV